MLEIIHSDVWRPLHTRGAHYFVVTFSGESLRYTIYFVKYKNDVLAERKNIPLI